MGRGEAFSRVRSTTARHLVAGLLATLAVPVAVTTAPEVASAGTAPQAWVSSAKPDGGTVKGGTRVVLEGDGFTGATQVLFGGVPGKRFRVKSDELIVVRTPKHQWGDVAVQVVHGTNVGTSDAYFYYEKAARKLPTTLPLPSDAAKSGKDGPQTDVDLRDLTCASPALCVAVGSYVRTDYSVAPLLATRTNGAWSARSVLLPAGVSSQSASLWDVECPSAAFCLVDGSAYPADGGNEQIVLRWDGASWTHEVLPDPPGGTLNGAGGFQCLSASFCVATGSATTASSPAVPAVATWNGSSWTSTILPLPAGSPEGRVHSIDCVQPTWCLAVGQHGQPFSTGTETKGQLAVQFAAGTWTVAPNGAGPLTSRHYKDPDVGLGDVQCAAIGECTALGYYSRVYHLSGGVGTYSANPLPEAAMGELQCPTSTSCWTALTTRTNFFRLSGNAFRYSFTGAATTRTPIPVIGSYDPDYGGNTGAYLQDLACISATRCVAVGTASRRGGRPGAYHGMVIHSQPSWRGRLAPGPQGSRGVLVQQVTVLDATHALVVGKYWTNSPYGEARPFAFTTRI